ncbi:Alpha-galactosidase [subsurface metagenome]
MDKIAFIGAGSFEFTRTLVRDILTFPRFKDSTIVLMDIDAERLRYSRLAVERLLTATDSQARLEATQNRRKALEGADAVICSILCGGVDVWRSDVEIPKKYGVDINVGDTRGPAGIFRALRTIPVMLEIARDVHSCCPQALFLNYTNPMSMLCRALQRQTKVRVCGLCHSVQGTASMLARWIGAPGEEISYLCAGINHQAWFLEFAWNNEDAYPLIRKAIEREEIYREEIVRNEMFLHLGYYVTESSGHNSEYNWWFRKRPDLIERYCRGGTGWNPGEHAFILKEYLARERDWKKQIEAWLKGNDPLVTERGPEYAAPIIDAFLGGEPFCFHGNLANKGLITNLPPQACVEVPITVDSQGFHPIPIGALPPQCAALNNIHVACEEMAVEGCLTGNPRLIFQAIAYDPLTAAVLSLAEIRQMVNDMLRQNRNNLPTFKHFNA